LAVAPSTRAIEILDRAGIPFRVHRYDAKAIRDGRSLAETLEVDPWRVLKTLVIHPSGASAVGVLPVTAKLDLKAFARAVGAKHATLADTAQVERFTGYKIGAISPIGMRHTSTTVIDCSVQDVEAVFVSAGQRGLELQIAATDLAAVVGAIFSNIGSPRS
jgi:Cys-tRNA(Pro)/Cys-tRNA(Cys) deacylase